MGDPFADVIVFEVSAVLTEIFDGGAVGEAVPDALANFVTDGGGAAGDESVTAAILWCLCGELSVGGFMFFTSPCMGGQTVSTVDKPCPEGGQGGIGRPRGLFI